LPIITKDEAVKALAKAGEAATGTPAATALGAKVGDFDKVMQIINNPLVMKYIDRILSRFLPPIEATQTPPAPASGEHPTVKGKPAENPKSNPTPQPKPENKLTGVEILGLLDGFLDTIEDKSMTVDELRAYIAANAVGFSKLIDLGIARFSSTG